MCNCKWYICEAYMRKIIHVDMDAFFASVEQHDNPELKGKPVAVGGSENRGVVAAASYEARKYGVRSAMPSVTAARLCKELIFVRPRFERYREVSNQIMEIFHEYSDLVEPLSLDEAYIDVTEHELYATKIASQIKEKILEKTGLTASAGVSFNKFLAKIASDLQKPNGLTVITPENAQALMFKLNIAKFYGVGEKTAEKMRLMGIHNGADIYSLSEDFLKSRFGKAGAFYYQMVRCNDNRPVQPHRERKSLGAEDTFETDITEIEDLYIRLKEITGRVIQRLEKRELKGRTITLKIKYHDFTTQTRSKTLDNQISHFDDIYDHAIELLNQPEIPTKPIRLLGVTLSGFEEKPISIKPRISFQLTLDLK
ncbi:MAG: DNA polymerase IV [Bacteroidetes bacterium]|nr:DNA polymerase IV [Bacteroidota bacterium]